MAEEKRTILPDLRELMTLPCGTSCDLDLDVVLERVVAAARHVSSARYAPLGVLDRSRRERERFVTAGVDEVTRRRIYALPRGRGVLAELIANPVSPRVAELGAPPDSCGFPGGIPPMMTFFGAAVMIVREPLGDLRARWPGGVQRARRGGRSAASGGRGDSDRPRAPVYGFEVSSLRIAADHGAA
jgi:hypothetical protein